jgi:hypothetical protein
MSDSSESSSTPSSAAPKAEWETRECPFCKEEVKSAATKCKHCGSFLGVALPQHGGTCPYCKEAINAEAIKCKHCKSSLVDTAQRFPCGCAGPAVGTQQFEPSAASQEPRATALGRPHQQGQGLFPVNCWLDCWIQDGRNVCRVVCETVLLQGPGRAPL